MFSGWSVIRVTAPQHNAVNFEPLLFVYYELSKMRNFYLPTRFYSDRLLKKLTVAPPICST
jgi:hypothetical protein